MTVVFGQGDLGVITAGTRRYSLTWDDLLWAARMLIGECGTTNATSVEGAAVLWAMASRFMHVGGGGPGRYPTYTIFIRAYSQPINPRWFADGDKCAGRTDGMCSPERTSHRAELSSKPWEQIPGDIQNFVVRWARGEVDNPVPRATDFAVPRVANRPNGPDFELVWDTLGRSDDSRDGFGNAFYSIPRSRTWPDRYIRISFGTSTEASDSNIEEVSQATRPFGQSRAGSGETGRTLLQPPPNQVFERIITITSDRTTPPDIKYGYLTVQGNDVDPHAQDVVPLEDEERLLKTNPERFWNQISSLKTQSNVAFAQVVPVIAITTERDEGGFINLNEEIFSQSPFHGYQDQFDIFPDRPLASIVSFGVTIQEPRAGGVTGIALGKLVLHVHNPWMVTREHPKGKYIAYMMSQGFVMRIRYGYNGADPLREAERQAFQWKEEDFFVQSYTCRVNKDGSMNLDISLMPSSHRLLNQMRIGESLPVANMGRLTDEDINNAIENAVSGDPDATEQQVTELRNRLSQFQRSYNQEIRSPGIRLAEGSSGSFGSVLHAALTNSEIFRRQEGVQTIEVPNFGTALQSLQATLLTRRFETILRRNCYRYTHNASSIVAVNIGPLMYHLVKPEIDAAFGYITQNNLEIGEKFSVDDRPEQSEAGNIRTNVQMIFGLFNPRAGQWANKPISMFPINVSQIFAYLRQQRSVGDFSSTVNAFIHKLNDIAHEAENFTPDVSQGSDRIKYRIEQPQIKYVIYPHPTDETSWIMYVYDNKTPVVQFREAVEAFISEAAESGRTSPDEPQSKIRPPTKDQVKEILALHKIPWIEMGEEGTFVKEFSAETISDDMLSSHALVSLNRQSQTIRDLDASMDIPAGVSREFLSAPQGVSQERIRAVQYVSPVQVSIQTTMLPTSYLFGPVYIFFPVRMLSGIYFPMQIRHDVTKNAAITNMNLQINLSVFNQIAL